MRKQKNKKKHWILVGVVLLLVIIVVCVLFYFQARSAVGENLQKITYITVTANDSYKAGEALKSEYIKVIDQGLYKDGNEIALELPSDQYMITPAHVPEHGHDFEITVTLISDESVSDSDTALINREETLHYNIGRTDPEQLQAVLYDNGDMEIVGSGEAKKFSSSDIPWRSDDILYLTWIDPDAEVESMDYWFYGSEVFAGMICQVPDTVLSMVQTFYQCKAMNLVPDMTTGVNLEDITGCYSGSAVIDGGVLPGNLRIAEEAYKDCKALVHAANAEACVRLTNMKNCYSGCSALADTSTPDSAINLEGVYQNCLNIKEVSVPSKVENLTFAFSGCTSLTTVNGDIPATCIYLSSAFKDCKFLSGDLKIHCAATLSGTFSGAATNGGGLTILLSWEGQTAAYQTPEDILASLVEAIETQAKTDGSNITIIQA